MKIEDNFIDQEKFDVLQTFMMSQKFPWHYTDGILYGVLDSDGNLIFSEEVDKNKFQFVHEFYDADVPCSSHWKTLIPILEIINATAMTRIKANLRTRTSKNEESFFHVDLQMSKEKLKQWTTSIFYVNTNNGYTKFEDGTKVESVANRLVSFPANMKHLGTSCTDQKTRVVINFNYFTKDI